MLLFFDQFYGANFILFPFSELYLEESLQKEPHF